MQFSPSDWLASADRQHVRFSPENQVARQPVLSLAGMRANQSATMFRSAIDARHEMVRRPRQNALIVDINRRRDPCLCRITSYRLKQICFEKTEVVFVERFWIGRIHVHRNQLRHGKLSACSRHSRVRSARTVGCDDHPMQHVLNRQEQTRPRRERLRVHSRNAYWAARRAVSGRTAHVKQSQQLPFLDSIRMTARYKPIPLPKNRSDADPYVVLTDHLRSVW